MKKIFSLLMNQVTLAILGFIFLIALIWFAGALLDISAPIRAFIIIFFILQGIVVLVIKRMLATKQAAEIEGYLSHQAEEEVLNAGLEDQENTEALKTQLTSAIASIKKSKLSNKWWKGSKAALYELPWYIIIGPPSGGKSTLLKSSSLYFPQISETGKGIQGVGGTRNCDWWFSNEAIFLDTAGRYSTSDHDNPEWLGFLDLLQKYRKRKPINGVLLSVSISELLEASEEEVETISKKLRDRLDELIQKLKVNAPVYITFTKCDLIKGFVDFFNDFSVAEREQVWGVTFSAEEIKKNDPATTFKKELNQLSEALDQRRLHLLDKVLNQKQRDNVLLFPLQFERIQERLLQFMKELVQSNPYQEFPMFRGFYFTCGTQEGNPLDQVISKMGTLLNCTDDLAASLEDETEKKSYFIKNLITKVVIPDQMIGKVTAKAQLTRSVMQYSLLIAPILLSIGLVVSFATSYSNNSSLLNKLKVHLVEANGMDWTSQTQLYENISSMELLKDDLAKLVSYKKEGLPLSLGWGLYKGKKVDAPSRKIYFKKFNALFVEPIATRLEKSLRELARRHPEPGSNEWKELYSRLKLYLMLGQPDKIDLDFVKAKLPPIWKEEMNYLADGNHQKTEIVQMGMEQLDFFIRQLKEEDAPRITFNKLIVKESRNVLNDMPVTDRLYTNIISDGKDLEAFTLRRHLSDSARITLKASSDVLGAFTQAGWKHQMKEAITNAFNTSTKENWVLESTERKEMATEEKDKWIQKLRATYLKGYRKEWKTFLKGLSIPAFSDLNDSIEKLEILSDTERSPYLTLFQKLKENLELEKSLTAQKPGGKKSLYEKGLQKIGMGEKSTGKTLLTNPLGRDFGPVALFIESEAEGSVAPLTQYLGALKEVANELTEINESGEVGAQSLLYAQKILNRKATKLYSALKLSNSLFKDLNSFFNGEIQTILNSPLDHVWRSVLSQASAQLNRNWNNRVYTPFNQGIQGRYPFNPKGSDSNEAAIVDVAEFFRKDDGTLWTFFNSQLTPFVRGNVEDLSPKIWRGRGIKFSPAFNRFVKQSQKITQTLFRRSKTEPKISYQIQPRPNNLVSEFFVTLDGKDYRFLQDPDEWPMFSWPATSGTSGATIEVNVWKKGWDGERLLKKSNASVWGLFKLLDEAKVSEKTPKEYNVKWHFDAGSNQRIPVTFRLKAESHKNPFRSGFFSSLDCPSKIL